jgi:hypothetical protein
LNDDLGGIHQMFPQFFYDYSFYNSSPRQSGCTKFFQTRKNCRKIVEELKNDFADPRPAGSGEELWKNCINILRALVGAQNISSIFPQFFPVAYRTRVRKIFLQFFHNFSTIIPCWQFTLVRKQRFHSDLVEKL